MSTIPPQDEYITNQSSLSAGLTFAISRSLAKRQRKHNDELRQDLTSEMAMPTSVTGRTIRQSVLSLATRWQAQLGCPGSSNKADLASTLGVSRARVTQVLSVLEIPEPVRQALEQADARGVVVTERMWRSLKGLPHRKILKTLEGLTSSKAGSRPSGASVPGSRT